MTGSLMQLLDEQARVWICGEFGHSGRLILPVQKRDETREVLAGCDVCHEQGWVQLPPEGWERLMKDLTEGRIR